jgi:hypothetical protein
MKTPLHALLLGCALTAQAQSPSVNSTAPPTPPSSPSLAGSDFYYVAERGPNHRIWNHITWFTNSAGIGVARTNSYAELATGMALPRA